MVDVKGHSSRHRNLLPCCSKLFSRLKQRSKVGLHRISEPLHDSKGRIPGASLYPTDISSVETSLGGEVLLAQVQESPVVPEGSTEMTAKVHRAKVAGCRPSVHGL